MMMPANFSAVSENEMTYVMGGAIGDYLMDPMGKAEWKKFSTNLTTIVGNKYLQSFVNNTVGTVFSGTYGATFGNTVLGQFSNGLGQIWGMNYTAGDDAKWTEKAGQGALGVLNCALNVVGNLAAIYNLGFGTVDNAAKGIKITIGNGGPAAI